MEVWEKRDVERDKSQVGSSVKGERWEAVLKQMHTSGRLMRRNRHIIGPVSCS